MTWIILMVLALCLSLIALRWMNILLSFVAMAAWFGLLAYNVNYPLANVVQGSNVDTFIIWAITIAAIAIPIITISRMQNRATNGVGSVEGDGLKQSARGMTKSISDMSTEEYQVYLRSQMRQRRR